MRVLVVFGVLIRELALWQACRAQGIEINVVGADSAWADVPETERQDSLHGLEARFLELKRPWPHADDLWNWLHGLRRVIASIKPDLVHVLSEPWGARAIQVAMQSRPKEVKVCVHGAENVYEQGGKLERACRRRILRSVLPKLSGFASWNEDGVRLARQYGLRDNCPSLVAPAEVPDPLRFVPASEAERGALRAKFSLPREGLVIGFLGRLTEEKGVGDALRAVQLLGPSAPILAIWGSGPLEGSVISSFARGINGHFGGHLARNDVPAALRCCDVVLVPSKRTRNSRREQFGRTALEAMFCGCSVIAYDSGELPRLIGEAGVVVDEGDVDGLAHEINALASSPEKRNRLGETGRNRALRRFSPEVLAGQMVSFWRRVSQSVND